MLYNKPKIKYQPQNEEELFDIVNCAKNLSITINIDEWKVGCDNIEKWFIYFIWHWGYSDESILEELYFTAENSSRYKTLNSDAFYRALILKEY